MKTINEKIIEDAKALTVKKASKENANDKFESSKTMESMADDFKMELVTPFAVYVTNEINRLAYNIALNAAINYIKDGGTEINIHAVDNAKENLLSQTFFYQTDENGDIKKPTKGLIKGFTKVGNKYFASKSLEITAKNICRIIFGTQRYNNAIRVQAKEQKANEDRIYKKLQDAAAILGVSVETLISMQK